jgi:hypothetical protein
MDKRIIAIGSIVLGLAAIILSALRFINGSGDVENLTEILIYSIIGSAALFYGIHVVYTEKPSVKQVSPQKQRTIPQR